MIAEVIPAVMAMARKRVVDAMPIGQTERDVGGAAGGVHAKFGPQTAHQREHLLPGGTHGTDRHDKRIDDDVVGWNAVIGGTFHDGLGHREPHIRIFGNAGFIVGDGHHGHVEFLDQREDLFHPFALAGDRVDQRSALADFETRLQRAGDGTVYADRYIDGFLNQINKLAHEWRFDKIVVSVAHILGHLVLKDRAGIDIQHIGASGNLRAEAAIADYVLTYDIVCFCPQIQFEVTVAGGQVTITEVRADVDITDDGQTVEAMFDEIERAIDEGAFNIAVTYDKVDGHPVDYFIDVEEMMADEEYGITVVSLEPAP